MAEILVASPPRRTGIHKQGRLPGMRRFACVLGALIFPVLTACGSSESSSASAPLTFPKGFIFGTSVAGFQVDMGCPTLDKATCDDPNSDWYQFVTSPDTVGDPKSQLNGESPDDGPGEWELYEHDLDLLKDELHGTGFRMSIEWSRIFPQPTFGVDGYDALKKIANPEALAHYHAMFKAMHDRGITPLVTLNHYTLPTWIHDAVGCHKDLANCSPRGWLDKDKTVTEIAKYAGFCAKEFGDDVDLWATLNEPFAVLLPGYILPTAERSNPPAVTLHLTEAKTVLLGLIEAHARMYDAIKANDTGDADGDGNASQVGVVYAMAPIAPADPTDPLDVQGAKNVFYLWNMVYLNAVALGDLDANMDGNVVHRDDLANRMDYMGVNYYTRITAQGQEKPFLADLSPLTTFNALTLKTYEDYPHGIYEMAMIVKNQLHLPMIITENGAADPADDGTAPSYMVRHLEWLTRAIHDGADVRGYFYWSLMDNYEWNHGMSVKMGLYGMDPADPERKRVARQAVPLFRQIADANKIPDAVAKQYPAPDPTR